MSRLRTVFVLLSLVHGLTGCSDSRSPTAPTPPDQVTPPVTVGELVKGTVHDSALRPLAGARVELLDGPQAGMSATTDWRGEFSLTGTVDDTTRFRASMEGHVTATATILPPCDRCHPSRWVHLYLSVLAPPAALAGDYTLTFIANSTCANLPDELRRRSYEVTIVGDLAWPGPSPDTSFRVVPRGSAFPESLNYFYLNVAGDYVNIALGDHSDPGITERVADNSYFAFGGWTAVSVSTPVSAISANFQGWIDYCVNSAMGERYECTPSATVTRVRCESTHQLTLTRR